MPDTPLTKIATNKKQEPIEAYVQGSGPAIIIVHPGLDDGTSWGAVAQRLSAKFTVIRPVRRQYSAGRANPCSIADEADEIIKIAEQQADQSYIIGHSSGGIVALNALERRPELFAKAILYEPPISIDGPLGGKTTLQAQRAIASGNYSKALRIFLADVVRLPRIFAWVAQMAAQSPQYQFLIARQIDDLAAIDALGDMRANYKKIKTSTLLIGGDKSPSHLAYRLQALKSALPEATILQLHGVGHDAHVRQPGVLAKEILLFFEGNKFAKKTN